MITVLFFASLREAINKRQLEVPLEHALSVRELANRLEQNYPGLSLSGSLCAINEHYAEPEQFIKIGDTVAFFPPVSGG
jgi:molybdopterin synthase sulfur carrier subunit